MVLTLALIQTVDDEVLAYTPPPRYAAIHSQMIEGAHHLENMVSDLTHGIDNQDPSLLQQGMDELSAASTIYKALPAQISSLNGK
jgi:hypothetical protein